MEIRSVYIRGNPYYNGNMSETYFNVMRTLTIAKLI